MVPCFEGKSLKHPKATLEMDPAAKSRATDRSVVRQTVRRGPQEFHMNQEIAVVLTATISSKKRASAMVVMSKLELKLSLQCLQHVEVHGSVKSELLARLPSRFGGITLHNLSLFGCHFCKLLLCCRLKRLSNPSLIGIDILVVPIPMCSKSELRSAHSA